MQIDLQQVQQSVIKACREVGDFQRKESAAFDLSRIEQKEGNFNNLVSYVDKESEHMLVDALRTLIPSAGFITEEGTVSQAKNEEYSWIIDPLDGTTNFLHGLPLYAVSVGLAHKGVPVLGVVYHVVPDLCYHAIAGRGAFCNQHPIKVSGINDIRESLLATGFPYYHLDKRDVYLNIIKDFLATTHGIRRLGSAAIDLALVACGKLEGFFEYNLNPWDVAAGVLIVKEAGGVVSDFKGGDNFLFGGELCASNKNIHQQMLSVIKPQWGY